MECAASKYFINSISCMAAVCAGSLLAGCSQQAAPPPQEQPAPQPAAVSVADANSRMPAQERHPKTADAAGSRHAAPGSPVPAYARNFIGRYHANIPCEDDFVSCEQGAAEFILNLLPDGTVHRSIIHYGKVFTDRNAAAGGDGAYRKDTWTVNPEQTELTVHRKEGVNFYYRIEDPNRLVMDVEKIRNDHQAKNKEMFAKGYPQPARAYQLIRNAHSK